MSVSVFLVGDEGDITRSLAVLPATALEYGAAHGALVMTTPGDAFTGQPPKSLPLSGAGASGCAASVPPGKFLSF